MLKDPHSEGSLEDIAIQHELMNKIHDDMNTVAEAVNSMELMRRQLLDMKAMLAATKKDKTVIQTQLECGIQQSFFRKLDVEPEQPEQPTDHDLYET